MVRGAPENAEGLKVALLTPAFWPEVRRGTERMVHEVAAGLSACGHAPRVITSHPGRPGRGEEDGIEVVRVWRPPQGRLVRRQYEDYTTHVPFSYAALRAGTYDIAHAWFVTDAAAAARWRERTGRPAVHSYMGIPHHAGLMWKRGRLRYTLNALAGTDVTVALSRHAANEFRRWLGYDAPVIEPPVDIDTFKPGPPRTDEPTVICAAVANEDRKRVWLLVRAWPLVRRERPTARLLLNQPRNPAEANAVTDLRSGIEVVNMDDRAELARLYSSAWVSALPSIHEAFGLVLAEAMACGTPGVGSDCDGIPEVIDSPAVGRLFEPDNERELARAILEAFELAEDPATAQACRARAERLSRASRAEAYERLYKDLLAER
ncbi:MAG: phosphatidyl-myo-inositol alpha-mannosyltransferase [Solirubrobacteraceae bacterium]|nr:phosphatidyl-myo-inositol alpha-mannosyltransferase [Solirubrobacteraceae bacterium]